ncbi:MAG: tetratricopeptide repeat protein [Pirellulaceae bacterium]
MPLRIPSLPNYWVWGWPIGILAAVTCIYIPCLAGDYIWDDRLGLMLGNPQMDAPWGWLENWYRPQTIIYEPVTFDSFWVQCRLFGENRLVFHATNVLVHAANAVLLGCLLTRTGIPGARWAAFVYAVHPVAVESVAWIYERNNLLSVFFALAASLAWQRAPTWRSPAYGGAAALFALSLLSKSLTVLLPVVWLGFRIVRRTGGDPRFGQLVPFFLLSCGAGALRYWSEQVHALGGLSASGLGSVERVLHAARAVWFYAFSFWCPIDLHMPYARWSIDSHQPAAWLPLIGIVGLASLCALSWRSHGRTVAYAFGFAALNVLPLSGLVENAYFQHASAADRWQYFAMIGWATFAGIGVEHVRRASRPIMRRGALVVASAVILGLSAASWRQAHVDQGMETWCRHALAHNPDAWAAHSNLGQVLLRRGEIDDSIRHFRRAFTIQPASASVALNLGEALLRGRRMAEARAVYERAAQIHPQNRMLQYNYGLAALAQGDQVTAERAFADVVTLDPGNAAAHDKLGVLAARRKAWDESLAHYRAAVALAPGNARYRHNLGSGLERTHHSEAARQAYERAAQLDRAYVAPRLALARLAFERGDFETGQAGLDDILSFAPENASARTLREHWRHAVRSTHDSREVRPLHR